MKCGERCCVRKHARAHADARAAAGATAHRTVELRRDVRTRDEIGPWSDLKLEARGVFYRREFRPCAETLKPLDSLRLRPFDSPRMEKKTRPPTSPEGPAQGAPDTGQSSGAESGVLRLLAEDAKVSRETVETGRVRVAKVTHTRDQLIDETLGRTAVEVNRVPINRLIEKMPVIKEDGDLTIIPIVEETFVVQRRLMLKEEVHI